MALQLVEDLTNAILRALRNEAALMRANLHATQEWKT
jgi:hypothetical protein